MISALLSSIFGALWNLILSKFGMSTEQKLGRAEVTEAVQSQTLQEVADAKKIDDTNSRLNVSALRVLAGQWKRPS